LGGKVEYAQLLNDASEIRILARGERIVGDGEGLQGLDPNPTPDDTLTLILPPRKPPVEVPVIALFLKG
jgi:alpha-L-fucosidase